MREMETHTGVVLLPVAVAARAGLAERVPEKSRPAALLQPGCVQCLLAWCLPVASPRCSAAVLLLLLRPPGVVRRSGFAQPRRRMAVAAQRRGPEQEHEEEEQEDAAAGQAWPQARRVGW